MSLRARTSAKRRFGKTAPSAGEAPRYDRCRALVAARRLYFLYMESVMVRSANKKAPGVNLPRPLHTNLFLAMGAEHAASAAEHDARERRAAAGAGLAAPAVHLQKGSVAVVLSPARRVICKRDAVLFDEIL